VAAMKWALVSLLLIALAFASGQDATLHQARDRRAGNPPTKDEWLKAYNVGA
jgi:hypothetical protein